jgi:hypothetical protein
MTEEVSEDEEEELDEDELEPASPSGIEESGG